MTLKPDQSAELEALGPANVRIRLIGAGTNIGACVGGFKTGNMDRGDIESSYLGSGPCLLAYRPQLVAKLLVTFVAYVFVVAARRNDARCP
jgi:hypothetical protein